MSCLCNHNFTVDLSLFVTSTMRLPEAYDQILCNSFLDIVRARTIEKGRN